MELRINPYLDRLVCSATGQTVPHHGFQRPVGLCPCCPPPGKPVEALYRLDALRDDRAGDWRGPEAAVGLWRHAALLPVWGVDDAYAADVGRPVFVRHEALARELGLDWPQCNDELGWGGEFVRNWGVTHVPFVFILDRAGRLVGTATEADWAELARPALEPSPN